MSGWDTPVVGLEESPGYWLRPGLIAWPPHRLPPGENPAALDWRLHWSATDRIDPTASEPVSWQVAGLSLDASGLPQEVLAQFPHLHNYLALRLPQSALTEVPEALRCQVALSVHLPSGRLAAAGQKAPQQNQEHTA